MNTPLHPAPNTFLEELLTTHGLRAAQDGGWVSVEGGRLRISAEIGACKESAGSTLVQLVVRVAHPALAEGVMSESFVGVGADAQAAYGDALHAFMHGLFHVLLSALLVHPAPQATVETWHSPDGSRQITLGEPVMRGSVPAGAWPCALQTVLGFVSSLRLPGEAFVLSYLVSCQRGQSTCVELSINGTPLHGLNTSALADAWSGTSEFFTVRVFFIVTNCTHAVAAPVQVSAAPVSSSKPPPLPVSAVEAPTQANESKQSLLKPLLIIGVVLFFAVKAGIIGTPSNSSSHRAHPEPASTFDQQHPEADRVLRNPKVDVASLREKRQQLIEEIDSIDLSLPSATPGGAYRQNLQTTRDDKSRLLANIEAELALAEGRPIPAPASPPASTGTEADDSPDLP